MPNILHILLRILAGIAGALLLYVAFFLYEDEEARLQNRLEQIWKRINALQSSAMSKEVAFLQGATRTTSAILDRLLGHKLVSAESIAVSFCFSGGSLYFGLLALEPEVFRGHAWAVFVVILVALFLFIMGSRIQKVREDSAEVREDSAKVRDPGFIRVGCLELMIALVILLLGLSSMVEFFWEKPLRILGVLMWSVSICIDIYFIVFFRWVLKKIAGFVSLWTIIYCFVAVSAMAVLLGGPAFAAMLPSFRHRYLGPPSNSLLWLICYISTTNLVDTFCLLLLMLIMVLLLTHRLIWPLIKRPIYAANRKQLIKNTKLLGALGTMLLLYAFPNNPVVKWITQYVPFLRS